MASLSPEEELVLATVRRFVDGEVRPVAQELEHANEYPGELIDRMNELGAPRWRAPSPAAARTCGR
jgi:alkylation response protein AidB-like acyl-CoA dehydrogenase